MVGPAVMRPAFGPAAHCHLPAALGPEQRKALEQALRLLAGAAERLEHAVRDGPEGDLSPAQAAAIWRTLRDMPTTLVDGHFKLRGWCDRARDEPGGCGITAGAYFLDPIPGHTLTALPLGEPALSASAQ